MLAQLLRLTGDPAPSTLLSIGSGTGLFEIPMLQGIQANGGAPKRFVGVDIDADACRLLRNRLRSSFLDRLDYQVLQLDFAHYHTAERFELVLMVHTFEYLVGDPMENLHRAHGLAADGGQLLLFSPQRGGINAIYEQVTDGCFADDLERMLSAAGLDFDMLLIEAECDVDPLSSGSMADRLALLSFLTQLDCRKLDPQQLDALADYYRSLRDPVSGKVPHPTTAFVIAR